MLGISKTRRQASSTYECPPKESWTAKASSGQAAKTQPTNRMFRWHRTMPYMIEAKQALASARVA
eukprot:9031783-Lingulodinium_polyedra.AAC.1